jgi:hypothetical protein
MPGSQQKHRSLDVGRQLLHPAQNRMLGARAYRDLGRRPRLRDLPVRQQPYMETALTAAAFIFLAYLVLGGA